jgi:hypothetical protein
MTLYFIRVTMYTLSELQCILYQICNVYFIGIVMYILSESQRLLLQCVPSLKSMLRNNQYNVKGAKYIYMCEYIYCVFFLKH